MNPNKTKESETNPHGDEQEVVGELGAKPREDRFVSGQSSLLSLYQVINTGNSIQQPSVFVIAGRAFKPEQPWTVSARGRVLSDAPGEEQVGKGKGRTNEKHNVKYRYSVLMFCFV